MSKIPTTVITGFLGAGKTTLVRHLLAHAPNDRIAQRPVVEALVASAWRPAVNLTPAQALAFAHLWLGGQKC